MVEKASSKDKSPLQIKLENLCLAKAPFSFPFTVGHLEFSSAAKSGSD